MVASAINPVASHELGRHWLAEIGNRTWRNLTNGSGGRVVYGSSVENERRTIVAAEMDRMAPQERAGAVDASIARSWDEVSPQFRRRIVRQAGVLIESLKLENQRG
jgi:hypothetical protein